MDRVLVAGEPAGDIDALNPFGIIRHPAGVLSPSTYRSVEEPPKGRTVSAVRNHVTVRVVFRLEQERKAESP